MVRGDSLIFEPNKVGREDRNAWSENGSVNEPIMNATENETEKGNGIASAAGRMMVVG
jgi:hypothetical protein